MRKVLVLSPHTDDETLGCGGVIHQLIQGGDEVHVALFSHGGAGIKWKGEGYESYSNSKRLGEFFEALGQLGVVRENVHLFCEGEDVIHHRMDQVAVGDLVSFVERVISEVGPRVLFVPYAGYDQDHMAVNRVSRVVSRPHFFAGTVFEYAVGSETDFVPNVFFHLSREALDKKLAAFACYGTQQVKSSHLLSSEQVLTMATRFGAFAGTDFAEGFIARRVILDQCLAKKVP